MTQEEIVGKIKFGLKDCSDKYQIAPKGVRIKILNEIKQSPIIKSMTVEKIKCFVMNNDVTVKDANGKDTEVSVKDLLQLNAMEEMFLNGYLKTALKKLADKNKSDYKNTNARIFTTSLDFNPSICLYEGDRVVTPITLNDLIS